MDECKPLLPGAHGVRVPRPGRGAAPHRGKAVQADPIKPKLKPPRTKLVKLKYDVLLSRFAFKFNLRRCIAEGCSMIRTKVGAYTRPLFG